MTAALRRFSSQYPELAWVLVAAAVGLLAPDPGRALARHQAINIVLAVLVFSAALTVPRQVTSIFTRLGAKLFAVTAATSVAVVGIAWLASHLVTADPLRFGVIAIGVAPVEIATLGIAPLGGGDSLASGLMLVGSTLLTAVFAGPVVALLATGTEVDIAGVIATLLIVVVVPFAVGLGVRSSIAPQRRGRAQFVVVAAVAILVWLVASEAHLSAAYVRVLAALAVIIVSSSIVGAALGRLVTPPAAVSTVFAASMRDFAIASGIATAAFGAPAAAPLSLYGIMVMLWGTGLAGTLRRRVRSRATP